jgi:GDPmannose 4,6-dehydratase
MKNKKALIIGVTGQDGSYLAELLLKKKYKVHAILRKVSLKKNKNRFWRINEFKKNIIFHNASLNEYKKLSNLIKKIKPHEIYHLAAQSYINYRFDDEFFQLNPNINGTHYILSAIKNYSPKSKFYFASSSEMFGNVNSFPQNENTKLNPRSAYGISKVAGYQLTKNYREAHNIYACTGILYNHESPRRGINFVTKKIVNGVAKIHLKKKKKIILGDINAKRDWGYAGDYVLAMWKMLQQSKPTDFVIGTGKLHSVKDFLRIAFEYVGLNYKNYIEIDSKLIRPKDNAILKANIFRAKKYLKWKPKVNFKNLVIDMIKSEIKLMQINKTAK